MATWDKHVDMTPKHYMPYRSDMCRQLGTILFGDTPTFETMPGTYADRWYELLAIVRTMVADSEVNDGNPR